LGTRLVKELIGRGHEVWGCDLQHRRGHGYIRADVSNYRQMERIFDSNKYDYVYHLAAEFGRINGEEYYDTLWQTNVVGTRNILEIQKRRGFRMIFASSSEIYGEIKADYLKEDMKPEPQKNDYAISKWVCEIQCNNFRERYNNKIMVLRFFNSYGPGELYTPYRSVVCLFCYKALHGLAYEVYKGYYRVFLHFYDFIPTLANACESFIDGEIINIGGREYRSVEELSNIILKELGKTDVLVKYLSEDKHNIASKRPDITKAENFLSHNPIITLEEGIQNTLAWMKEVYGR